MSNSDIWSDEHELGAQIPIRIWLNISWGTDGCNGGIIIIPFSLGGLKYCLKKVLVKYAPLKL